MSSTWSGSSIEYVTKIEISVGSVVGVCMVMVRTTGVAQRRPVVPNASIASGKLGTTHAT